MNDLISFFKEIFMLKNDDCKKIGLCQFNPVEIKEKKVAKKVIKPASEVKLSDLMRRSY